MLPETINHGCQLNINDIGRQVFIRNEVLRGMYGDRCSVFAVAASAGGLFTQDSLCDAE